METSRTIGEQVRSANVADAQVSALDDLIDRIAKQTNRVNDFMDVVIGQRPEKLQGRASPGDANAAPPIQRTVAARIAALATALYELERATNRFTPADAMEFDQSPGQGATRQYGSVG